MRLGVWWCAAGGIRAARCGEGSGEIKASRRKAQIDTQWEEKKKSSLAPDLSIDRWRDRVTVKGWRRISPGEACRLALGLLAISALGDGDERGTSTAARHPR
jgi:hypothetical protein